MASRLDLVYPNRALAPRVNPQEGILPIVRELDLHEVFTLRTSGTIVFENCVRAFARASNACEDEPSAFIVSNPWRAACFAEGCHAPVNHSPFALIRKRGE